MDTMPGGKMKGRLACSLFLLCALFVSCSPSLHNLKRHIGLYKVETRQCEITSGIYELCNDIRFLEVAQGRFHGMGENQISLVFWRVETTGSNHGPLLYSAEEIRNPDTLAMDGNRIWLANKKADTRGHGHSFVEDEKVYFLINEGRLSEYCFILKRRNKQTGQIFKRHFRFQIVPAKQENMRHYSFIYPEEEK